MPHRPILAQFWPWKRPGPEPDAEQSSIKGFSEQGDLHTLTANPEQLPHFVRESLVAQRYLRLLSPLNWALFPERPLDTPWHVASTPYRPFVAACLIKLDQRQIYMSQLYRYLVEHPALVWLLGFPLMHNDRFPWGFDAAASLPTPRHFTRLLRTIPNLTLQWLLDETVRLLQQELVTEVPDFGQAISLDTKHILAWVKQNNPKAYVSDRYDKTQQPAGDPDCRLGCKRKRNQRRVSESTPPTPRSNPRSPTGISVAEYYWGYASGVVATKVPGWAEIVLAELTQPFNASDLSYFEPLMADTERRLGFRPRFGAFDAAFDAWYVYEHFYREGEPLEAAFAAVPFAQRGGKTKRFDSQGLPLCAAHLPMPLKSTYFSRTSLVPHECGVYACPLQYPKRTAEQCPINDKHWAKGGCTTRMATSIGARIRYQLDRDSASYKAVYKQRTATERINSLAKDLGIERPYLRNRQAITNQTTLIYVLLNLRAWHRVRQQKAARQA